ncbi:hypothetical protein NDU88_002167 [Pleurodeles waltl]|uniref:Uncharacterized protein n=1 Tax=Pleurodeles waltl TaxID=8319 RepID=A0AAV7VCI2_PLEWA|nr:hypothetical protein NDU88_002167 [Pleurodeles waltl]
MLCNLQGLLAAGEQPNADVKHLIALRLAVWLLAAVWRGPKVAATSSESSTSCGRQKPLLGTVALLTVTGSSCLLESAANASKAHRLHQANWKRGPASSKTEVQRKRAQAEKEEPAPPPVQCLPRPSVMELLQQIPEEGNQGAETAGAMVKSTGQSWPCEEPHLSRAIKEKQEGCDNEEPSSEAPQSPM